MDMPEILIVNREEYSTVTRYSTVTTGTVLILCEIQAEPCGNRGNTALYTHFTASATNIHCEGVAASVLFTLQLQKELWLSEIITCWYSNYNTFLGSFCL